MSHITIKELKELIKDLDDDIMVVLSRDPEGNGYSPAHGYSHDHHFNAKEAEIVDFNEPEDYLLDELEPEELEKLKQSVDKCFVLWP